MDEFRCGGGGGSGTCPPQVYTIVSGSCRIGGGGDCPFNITEPVWVACIYVNRWLRRLRGREHCVLIDCVRRATATVPPARRDSRTLMYTRGAYIVS